ncbi:Phenylalanyl-tRNA synthetase beta subunit [Aphelenchoides besseyi]|nr:Phenylalanyl-tRNA synthetase beta subunit [Aphelenchoides besseyi]
MDKKSSKRVVILHPDLGIGGAERLVLDAALAFRESEHEVSIVTNHFSESHCFEDALKFRDDIFVIARWFPRSIFGRFNALCAYIRLCIAALFVLFKLDCDVVFMDSISLPLVVFRLFSFIQSPHLIFYCHYPDKLLTKREDALKKFYRFFVDGLERWSIGMADKIYVNSEFTKSKCEEEFPALKKRDRLDVLYPTLRTDSLNIVANQTDFKELDEYEVVFLSINRYEKKKNVGLAIEAFSELLKSDNVGLTKCVLVIAGGYDPQNEENELEFNKLKALAKEKNVEENVIFLKSPSDSQKVELLRRCHMVIYTPENEHFGIVPLEAMYMERCVLAHDSGGPKETVKRGITGFLSHNTSEDFAKFMQKAIIDPELIRKLGSNGKQRVVDLEMPTVNVKKRLLDSTLGKSYTQKELDDLFFAFGLELDDVVTEKDDNGRDEEIYKIEVPANRYDLLCVEGLSRALRVFNDGEKPPKYELRPSKTPIVLKVERSTKEIREYVVSAVLRNVSIDADVYASFIDLQDKLHQNICRKRTLVSVGTHDLDTIQPPFVYKAQKPEDIRFVPLNKDKEYNSRDLLELYKNDLHLREFVPIIIDKPLYPVICDSNGVICSLPPIINSEHSKIKLTTKNIFIEATATDLRKAEIVLDTLVTMFGQYCKEKFTVEPVKVVYEDNRIPETEYPKLTYRKQLVKVNNVNKKIGVKCTADEMVSLLYKMCLSAKINGKDELEVVVPPTRHDILHECDIAEDVALAYGYNRIVTQLPEAHTVAQPFPLNKLSDQLRLGIANAGWTEVLNFVLCSSEDISTKLRRTDGLKNSVKIANPKTLEFQVVRNSLLPGLLKTLSNNRDMALPLKLFEVQDIVTKDTTTDTNTRNQRNAAAIYCNKTGSFEVIHGLLDRIMELLDIPCAQQTKEYGYSIKGVDDPTFFPGRSAEISLKRANGETVKLGVFGVLHPDVLASYSLSNPCCALEINVEFNLLLISCIQTLMLSDCILIIAIAVFTALLGEGLTYILVYRSDEYKRLKSTMERKTKRLEKQKETVTSGQKQQKKEDRT